MTSVLVIGSGSREHALARQLATSPKVSKVLVAPGNGGTTGGKIERLVLDLQVLNQVEAWVAWCAKNKPDVVVVGPEDPLNSGIANLLKGIDVQCFGPSQDAAQIECDKSWAKHFMQRHAIPTPAFECFTESQAAIDFINHSEQDGSPVATIGRKDSFSRKRSTPSRRTSVAESPSFIQRSGGRCVVKAAGLAAGKGVLVANTREQAIKFVKEVLDEQVFGASAGSSVLIEERVEGFEVSVLAFCDGDSYKIMPPAQVKENF